MPSVAINLSSAGTSALVAAPTSPQFIRVQRFTVVNASEDTLQTFTLLSGATAKHGPVTYQGGGGESTQFLSGTFDCAPGEALNATISASLQLGGSLTYIICGQAPPN